MVDNLLLWKNTNLDLSCVYLIDIKYMSHVTASADKHLACVGDSFVWQLSEIYVHEVIIKNQ